MLATDLIAMLEDLIEKHKPMEEMMGPCVVMIDHFAFLPGVSGDIEYHGFSPNIVISWSEDGVYPILMATPTGCRICDPEGKRQALVDAAKSA